jgi:hypothetical protein
MRSFLNDNALQIEEENRALQRILREEKRLSVHELNGQHMTEQLSAYILGHVRRYVCDCLCTFWALQRGTSYSTRSQKCAVTDRSERGLRYETPRSWV